MDKVFNRQISKLEEPINIVRTLNLDYNHVKDILGVDVNLSSIFLIWFKLIYRDDILEYIPIYSLNKQFDDWNYDPYYNDRDILDLILNMNYDKDILFILL